MNINNFDVLEKNFVAKKYVSYEKKYQKFENGDVWTENIKHTYEIF